MLNKEIKRMIKSAFIARTLLLSPSREELSKESLIYKQHAKGSAADSVLLNTPTELLTQEQNLVSINLKESVYKTAHKSTHKKTFN